MALAKPVTLCNPFWNSIRAFYLARPIDKAHSFRIYLEEDEETALVCDIHILFNPNKLMRSNELA